LTAQGLPRKNIVGCFIMLKFAVHLFFTIMLFMSAVGPTMRALASDGDNCENCPCDQLPDPNAAQHNKKHLPCPPQCAACFCFVLSVTPTQKPVNLFSPPTEIPLEEFFETSPALLEEDPNPPFQPPKA
jgi:hypothetical protein